MKGRAQEKHRWQGRGKILTGDDTPVVEGEGNILDFGGGAVERALWAGCPQMELSRPSTP